MSLVNKLRAYMVLIIVMLVALVVFSTGQISKISTLVSSVADSDNPINNTLMSMKSSVAKTKRLIDDYYISDNNNDIDDIRESEKLFEQFYSTYKNLVEADEDRHFIVDLATTSSGLKKRGGDIVLLIDQRRLLVKKIEGRLIVAKRLLDEEAKETISNRRAKDIIFSLKNIFSDSSVSFNRYPANREDNFPKMFLSSIKEARQLVNEYMHLSLPVQRLKIDNLLKGLSADGELLAGLVKELDIYLLALSDDMERINNILKKQIERPVKVDIAEILEESKKDSQVAKSLIFILGAICFTIAFIASWVISDEIVTPISALIDGTELIGEGGGFSHRIEVDKRNEFGKLATAFNDMSARLELSTNELKNSRDNLEDRVVKRTEELQRINVDLEKEIKIRGKRERDLNESRQRFIDFAETAGDWFWEFDKEMRLVYVSGRFDYVTGISSEEVIGKTRKEIFLKRVMFDDRLQHENHLLLLRERKPYVIQCMWTHKDGSIIILRDSGKPIFDLDGSFAGYRSTVADITVAHHLSKQLDYQKTHDPLTGLSNRREFDKYLSSVLDSVVNDKVAEHAICLIDLDQFRIINDTCGHLAGDELLRQLANLFHKEIRKVDILARLGGDEFGLLMEYCPISQANKVAEKLCKVAEQYKFIWNNSSFRLSVSIGIVPINEYSKTATDIMIAADAACYAAKKLGRNRVHIYQENDAALLQLHSDIKWVASINRALEKEQFCVYYQPIVSIGTDLDDFKSRGERYEIFIRMIGKDGALIMPGNFLPAAEMYNLSSKLDRWMVGNAIQWLSSHPNHVEQLKLCFINLSGKSIGDDAFLTWIKGVFQDSGVPPSKICFEITETATIANLNDAIQFITELKKIGCLFAIDDFGTGFSSFAYLKNLPVDFLKIDGEFVRHIVENEVDMSLVKSISEIGQIMGKKVIAEFVEDAAIIDKLRTIGVDFIQGYAIAEPKPIDDLIE